MPSILAWTRAINIRDMSRSSSVKQRNYTPSRLLSSLIDRWFLFLAGTSQFSFQYPNRERTDKTFSDPLIFRSSLNNLGTTIPLNRVSHNENGAFAQPRTHGSIRATLLSTNCNTISSRYSTICTDCTFA